MPTCDWCTREIRKDDRAEEVYLPRDNQGVSEKLVFHAPGCADAWREFHKEKSDK